MSAGRGSRASSHLDWIRGLAALEVFAGHVRQHFLADYGQLAAPSVALKLLYFATGFGHQSVIVFFVLSGYFISASVLGAHRRGRWSWRTYFLDRGVRLYMVLLPALVAGGVWDALCLHRLGPIELDHGRSVAEALTLRAFLGNALFLQGIAVPVFGSNGPLWSLSYEAWYYLAFAFLAEAAARGTARGRRLLGIAAAALILAGVGGVIASYFVVWLLGTAVAAAPSLSRRAAAALAAAGALAVAVVLAKIGLRGPWNGYQPVRAAGRARGGRLLHDLPRALSAAPGGVHLAVLDGGALGAERSGPPPRGWRGGGRARLLLRLRAAHRGAHGVAARGARPTPAADARLIAVTARASRTAAPARATARRRRAALRTARRCSGR
jgi:peptidoglycan/LPS O-acetylase OafA/YrhL